MCLSRAFETVAKQIVRIVQILFEVLPEPTVERLAPDAQQIEPGVLALEITIARHHRGERAERESIAAEAGRDELARRVLADIGQAVLCFDDLAHPPMPDFRAGEKLAQALSERLEDRFRILFLPGLDVLATEDDVLMIRVVVDSQIVVRITRIPEAPPGPCQAERVHRAHNSCRARASSETASRRACSFRP